MAANDVSIIGNVGTFTGLNGTAVIYLGTVNGKYGLFYKFLNTTPDPDAQEWAFFPRDAFLNGVALGDATYHSGVDINSMLNDGQNAVFLTPVSGNDWKVNVINDTNPVLPRLYNNQPFYSLRGQGINAIDANTASFSNSAGGTGGTTTTTTTTTGGTVTVTGGAGSSSTSNFIEDLLGAKTVTFIKENGVWILLIALVLAYMLYTKKGKKKSKFLGLF